MTLRASTIDLNADPTPEEMEVVLAGLPWRSSSELSAAFVARAVKIEAGTMSKGQQVIFDLDVDRTTELLQAYQRYRRARGAEIVAIERFYST